MKSLENTLKIKSVNESDLKLVEQVIGDLTVREVGEKVKIMIREHLANLDKKEQGESANIVRQISQNEQDTDG